MDVVPTILHLEGIDSKKYINFGTDLFSKDHDDTVTFRNGDYVTPKYTSISNVVYDTKTGKELKGNQETKNLKARVTERLKLSDSVMYKDLLRFHKLSDFTPVDPSKYHYGKEKLNQDNK